MIHFISIQLSVTFTHYHGAQLGSIPTTMEVNVMQDEDNDNDDNNDWRSMDDFNMREDSGTELGMSMVCREGDCDAGKA